MSLLVAFALSFVLAFPALPSHAKPTGFSNTKSKPTGNNTITKPQQQGPLSTRARERFEQTQQQVEAQRAAGANSVGETPSGSAGCTGLFCPASLDAATKAVNAATGIVTAANQMQQQAAQERSNILQQVSQGAQQGQYGLPQVQHLQETFRSNPLPGDNEIQAFHPDLRDAGHALRTNQQELDYLQDTRDNFNRAGNTARGIGDKINNVMNRGNTLGPGAAGRAPSAAYPSPTQNASGDVGQNSRISDKTTDVLSEKGPVSHNGLEDPSMLYNQNAGGGNFNSAGGAPPTAKSETGTPTVPTKIAEDPKKGTLSAEGQMLLAGMLSELKADIAAGPDGVGKVPGSSDKRQGAMGAKLVSVDEALQSFGPAETSRSVDGSRALASQRLLELEKISAHKTLFARVKDCLRKRTSLDGLY